MAYESVNGQWPPGTNDGRAIKPTPQEALTAARRIWRKGMGRPWRGKVKLTSGWRYTWPRGGTLYVNPDCRGGGWHELVHDLSHAICNRLFPNAKGHGFQHAHTEKELIRYVVESGFLDGKLRRDKPAKAKPDKRTERHAATLAKLARWQSKLKRAQTAIRKLERTRRYYEKTVSDVAATA